MQDDFPYEADIDLTDLEKLKLEVHENRNTLKSCPVCNSNIQDRIVSLYSGLISALYEVYVWCGKNGRHDFQMKDIRPILGHNNYARFGDLVRFGGLVYKNDKAEYGLNMARTKEFFHGQRSIPVQITLDQIENKIVASTYVFVWQFPPLKSYLDEKGLFDHEKLITAKPDWSRQKEKPLVSGAQAQLI